jgi:hypothetical protein
MNIYIRVMIAGFVATVMLSVLMLIKLPGSSPTIKGIVFGLLAWLLMMLIPLPMAGAGLFGMKPGMMAPVMTLVLHLVWGAVLGVTFGALSRSSTTA